MSKGPEEFVGMGFGSMFLVAIVAALGIEMIRSFDKPEPEKPTYKFKEAKRAFYPHEIMMGTYVRIEPLNEEEKRKKNIRDYAYRIHVFFSDGTFAPVRVDKGNIYVMSQTAGMTLKNTRIGSYKLKMPSGILEQSSHDWVRSVTRESKGQYLIVEKIKFGHTIGTYAGEK